MTIVQHDVKNAKKAPTKSHHATKGKSWGCNHTNATVCRRLIEDYHKEWKKNNPELKRAYIKFDDDSDNNISVGNAFTPSTTVQANDRFICVTIKPNNVQQGNQNAPILPEDSSDDDTHVENNLGSQENPIILLSDDEMETIKEDAQAPWDARAIFQEIMHEQEKESKEMEMAQTLFTQIDAEQQMETQTFLVHEDEQEETVIDGIIMATTASNQTDAADEDNDCKMPAQDKAEHWETDKKDEDNEEYIPSSPSSTDPMEEELASFEEERGYFMEIVYEDDEEEEENNMESAVTKKQGAKLKHPPIYDSQNCQNQQFSSPNLSDNPDIQNSNATT